MTSKPLDPGTEETAQWLRALTVLPEDPGLAPTCMVDYTHL